MREAFAHLSPCCQQLITLLTQNPPISYVQISTRLSTISADLQTTGSARGQAGAVIRCQSGNGQLAPPNWPIRIRTAPFPIVAVTKMLNRL